MKSGNHISSLGQGKDSLSKPKLSTYQQKAEKQLRPFVDKLAVQIATQIKTDVPNTPEAEGIPYAAQWVLEELAKTIQRDHV